MASKNFSGTLDLPLGSKAARMKWRFTHQKTTGDVIAASPETTELTETGEYNFDLKFGQILIESKLPSQQNWFSHGSVVIDENTAISTLPELLTATSPVTEDVILQMQAILQDARDAEASSLESSIEAQDLLNETQDLISSLKSVEEIKKKATLSLDFTKNEHKTYEALGLESKPLAEILTTERATAGTYQSPFGLRVAEPNFPRITYDEVTGSPLGFLCEANATNLFLNSEAPVDQSINTVAGDYTLSFLGGGEITMSGAASGSLVGGATRSGLTVPSSGGVVNLSISGDVSFVQFEAGLIATSYIKTDGAQVTRSRDECLLNNELNASEGTFFVDAVSSGNSGFNCIFGTGSGNSEELRAGYSAATGDRFSLIIRAAGADKDIGTNLKKGERAKCAVTYSKTQSGEFLFKFFFNSSLIGQDTLPDLPSGFLSNGISLGKRRPNLSSLYWNSTISHFSYIPKALSDEELTELTK